MRIIEEDPKRLHFEGHTVRPQTWLVWGGLFLPGMLALLLVPAPYRFVGLLIWMVLWLALIAVLVRWMGVTVRVTIDSQAQQIVWARNGGIFRTLPFAEIRQLDAGQLAIATRPYKTFQLAVVLKNGSRITLAVDPKEAEIRRALELAQAKLHR